tara:strand:- start:723 stop:1571 length:849 start_codon:yes stop_codon:yes gene_type:complete
MNPFKVKKGLGRGLSSLIGDSPKSSKKNIVSISSIVRNKFQPRKLFDKKSLEELTDSIKERGIIQPIVVRKSKDFTDKYEIVAGERRWLAAQNAGMNDVPVVEIDVDDLQSLEFAIVENVQRADLNPIEEALGYKRLINEFNYDQEKVAQFIGKSRAHISNCLRLLSLPKEVITFLEEGKLSQGHAKNLVGLENAIYLAKKIINKNLSVRQSENLIRIFKTTKQVRSSKKDPNIKDLENMIYTKTGIRTLIKNNKNNKGVVSFEYKSSDQLNRLIEVIKNHY